MTKSIPYLSTGDIIAKRCIKCGAIKPITDFHLDKHRKDGHYPKCKECVHHYGQEHSKELSQTATIWAKENPDKVREYHKKYNKLHPHTYPYKYRPRKQSIFHKNNLSVSRKWKQEHPEKIKEYRNKYQNAHPDIIQERRRKRRADRRGASGNGITPKQWTGIREEYGYRCVYCGKKCNPTLDHVVPISLEGKHDIDNAVPACKHCNCSKGNKSLLIFLYKNRNMK